MDIELEGIDAVLQVRDDRRCMIDERDEQGRERPRSHGHLVTVTSETSEK